MMASTVYLLCAATSLACAVMLLRGFLRTRVRLLLWSAVCFLGLSLDNGLLFVDRVLIPDQTLFALRRVFSLLGVAVLLFGLIWEGE